MILGEVETSCLHVKILSIFNLISYALARNIGGVCDKNFKYIVV